MLQTKISNKSYPSQIIRRFSPSVLFYLMCTVPTIWFLELERIDVYQARLEGKLNGTNSSCVVEQDLTVELSDIAGVRGYFRSTINLAQA